MSEEKETTQTTPLEEGLIDVYPEDPKKVVKKILVEGSGESPKTGCQVRVHYVGTLLDGKKFDSSRDRGDEFEFKLGVGQVIKGWDLGVASMKVGEKSDFTIAPDYAYGANGSPPTIPPNATLKFEIELFSFWKEPETLEEKMKFAEEHKNEGNKYVKQGEYAKARGEYERAQNMIQYITPDTEEMKKQHTEILISLHLNKGLCYLKQKDYLACVNENDQVLKLHNRNVKAIFRRASALRLMNELDPAVQDLQWCLQECPNDPLIRSELILAKKAYKEKQQKERKAFNNMFSRMHEMEDEENKKREDEEKKIKEEREKAKKEEEKKEEEKKEEEKKEEEKKEEEKKEEEKKEEEKKEEEKKEEEEKKSE